ncbi:MAG TPA: META domain-containing protein [Ignavibacteria bacterium]|nr:META domain-containing protein [Ignavibacteria bacterium]
MKQIKIFTALLTLFFTVNIASQVTGDELTKITGTWQAKLPCADCEYIDYRLVLNADNTYNDQMVYHDKDVMPFMTEGKWTYSDDIVTLNESTGKTQRLRHSNGSLTLLDASGNNVTNGTLTKLTREVTEVPVNDRWAAKRDKGIDFIGMGNEPFWNIDLNIEEKTITYSRLGEEGSVIFTDITEAIVMDAPIVTYHGNTAKHEITIEITKEECTDNMSGEVFPYKVTVKIRAGKSNKVDTLKGCGKYLADIKLNGKWLINKVHGKDISEYKIMKDKAPQISFSVSDERFGGIAGCNNFFGSFEAKGNKIRFGKTGATMMMCADMTLEKDMFAILNEGYYSFLIEGNVLTLIDMQGNAVVDFLKAN